MHALTRRFAVGIVLVACAVLPARALFGVMGRFTVSVKDESGAPVSGARVVVGFTENKTSGWGIRTKRWEGVTNAEGLVVATGDTGPYVNFHVKKAGYYPSGMHYEGFEKAVLGRWRPWNPTIEIVLKKKRNPVPMYAKDTGVLRMPALGEAIGYDLEVGDWVAPHGTGKQPDFIFTLVADVRGFTDYDASLSLRFSNPDDGIQLFGFRDDEQSYYKWPFEAPMYGYVSHLDAEVHMQPGGPFRSTFVDKDNFIFRVRTVTDSEGNISQV